MNTLPEPLVDQIYRHKHELEFRIVLNELLCETCTSNLFMRDKYCLAEYMIRNIDLIECVILPNSKRMSVTDYLNRMNKKIFN